MSVVGIGEPKYGVRAHHSRSTEGAGFTFRGIAGGPLLGVLRGALARMGRAGLSESVRRAHQIGVVPFTIQSSPTNLPKPAVLRVSGCAHVCSNVMYKRVTVPFAAA